MKQGCFQKIKILILIVSLLIPANVYALDSLAEISLRTVDLQQFRGKIEPPAIRLGLYSREVKLEPAVKIEEKGPEIESGFSAWHIMPYWSADLAGLLEGDTLIAFDGIPLVQDSGKGDAFMSLYLRNKKQGDTIAVTIIKNGKVISVPVQLVQIGFYEDIDFEDYGIGPQRKKSLLAENIKELELESWTYSISGQMAAVAHSDYNKVQYAERPMPWRLNAVSYLHYNPTRVGAYSRMISGDIKKGLQAGKGLSGVIQAASRHLDLPQVGFSFPKKPESFWQLDFYLGKVQRELDIAYKKISRKELRKTTKGLLKLLNMEKDFEEDLKNASDPVEKRDLRVRKEKELAALFANADKVDLFALVNAAKILAALLDPEWFDAFIRNTSVKDMTGAYSTKDGVEGEVMAMWNNGSGKCIIGGTGPNRYTGHFSFILDLGGNDVYELPETKTGSYRFVADLSGDDLYQSDKYSQGAGLGCVDVLFDIEGNDTYRAREYSQGAALLGIGIMCDLEGDDIYSSVRCSQGAAFLGIGMLYDAAGSDLYYSRVFSQGFGYLKGFGAIVEGGGNDSYKAGWEYPDSRIPGRAHLAMSQGFGYGMRPWSTGVGSDGGIGLLADFSGHDVYHSDFFSQGGSYWYSLGILHDAEGCDRYSAGQYSQGSGIHLSFGALLDDAGDDAYDAYAGLEQGNAHDWSSGCLEDMSGNDTYRGSTSSQGSALTVAYAYLLDASGDDRYYCHLPDTALSQGGGRFADIRKAGSLGVLFDLGGGDDYYTYPMIESGKAVLKGRKGFVYDEARKD